ncbi:hypothetical protein BH10PSE11_BH10PSE11_01240 [soil metagenome]
MQADRLVHMANQIGKFFATQDTSKASDAIAEHLRKFWDPRMRKQICAYFNGGGKGLDPLTYRAVEMIAAQQQEVANASAK